MLHRLLLALALLVPVAAIAQPTPAAMPSAPLTARANALVALFNGGGDVTALFAPEFLAQVPEPQLRAVAAQVTAGVGKAVRIASIDPVDANRATVVLACERGTVTMKLVIDPTAPNRITGLLVTGSTSGEASLSAIVATFKALPGATSFALADLGDTPVIVLAHDSDRALAIGSAFKLVILAELVRETAAGTRKWDDPVTLDGTELPGGGYNLKPRGTQVTIRELAEQMISVSDNSATDILLGLVGRERVEAMQKTLQIANPAANRPFLSTMEAFKLKGIAALGDRWLAADERARRKLLGEVDATPGSAIGPLFADGKPIRPDRIEWFLSATDLIRTMDWLRRNTESGPGADARRILAINPGITKDVAGRYGYAGFKGGSEPGVVSMTLLLQDKTGGGWHVLTATWNDPAAPIDTARFIGLMNRAAELAARP